MPLTSSLRGPAHGTRWLGWSNCRLIQSGRQSAEGVPQGRFSGETGGSVRRRVYGRAAVRVSRKLIILHSRARLRRASGVFGLRRQSVSADGALAPFRKPRPKQGFLNANQSGVALRLPPQSKTLRDARDTRKRKRAERRLAAGRAGGVGFPADNRSAGARCSVPGIRRRIVPGTARDASSRPSPAARPKRSRPVRRRLPGRDARGFPKKARTMPPRNQWVCQ